MLDKNIRGVFMSKYSFEEKCEAVQRVLDGMSSNESARIMGSYHSEVDAWFHLYENHGWEALRNGGASYDGAFKVMVVEYMHDNHFSYIMRLLFPFRNPMKLDTLIFGGISISI